MAPEQVRTVPPWIVQRPPRPFLPQHNHAPADPRRSRAGEPARSRHEAVNHDGGDDGEDGDEDDDEGLTMAGRPGQRTSAPAPAGDSSKSSGHAPLPVHKTKTPTPSTPPTTDKLAAPLPSNNNANGGDFVHRMSLLFRPKEGRKWDHLRSAEPVIVPQFHVTNRPSMADSVDDDEFGHGAFSSPATPTTVGMSSPGFASGAHIMPRAAGGEGRAGEASGSQQRRVRRSAPGVQNHYTTPWWYNESQWYGFIESSRYGHLPNEESEILNDAEMARLDPDFGYRPTPLLPLTGPGAAGVAGAGLAQQHRHWWQPRMGYWMTTHPAGSGGEKTGKEDNRFLLKRIWHLLLHHPLGPLACRLTVLMTSIVALVLAVEIFRRERLAHLGDFDSPETHESTGNLWATRQPERTQVIVAIVVDVVAVPYIGYITVDDYTGKPLGLRPPKDRIRLILTDLFFIIFKSMSTALGFEAMIFFNSEGSEGLLQALGAFELIGLVSWAMTLTINVFREIERLGG